MPEVITAPKQTLFAITESLVSMFDMLESSETPEDREVIEREISRVVGMELSQKVDGIVRFDRHVDLEVASLQELIKDVERKIGTLNSRKRQVREMTLRAMQALGATKLKGDLYSVSLRPGMESVNVTDEDQIPHTYFNRKEVMQLDKNRLKADLKAGVQVAGASLKTGDEILSIR
jgi:hypothetical protein